MPEIPATGVRNASGTDIGGATSRVGNRHEPGISSSGAPPNSRLGIAATRDFPVRSCRAAPSKVVAGRWA